ncbi:fumarylacetoacetase [Sneathiella limimaris]|uniref:fumarylacetoacetase n=1 Tax=Sneathiella limimaris TaxID=1964213 RepID=UPI00146EBC85|nr:fumarylacetoacetase [Sneathiella limimaris]
MLSLNETHAPNLKSWIATANDGKTDFPIQNLPFAVFRRAGSSDQFAIGVAIGDQILNLRKVANTGALDLGDQNILSAIKSEKLNELMSLGAKSWSTLRKALSQGLREGSAAEGQLKSCLFPMDEAEYTVPCTIPDYTDFYASVYHATNIGALFRPDNPLLPNYKWIPIGYHGRSSSIGVSGQTFPRPKGQTKTPDAETPSFGPCKRLDFELEMGILVGPGTELGDSVSIDQAEEHVFGMCLFNDWSARDIQAWEYQPLGPFLAKNFASTMSPWIVTMEALAPYRTSFAHPADDPQPMEYLASEQNSKSGGLDINLDVLIQTEKMKSEEQAPHSLATSNMKYSYWTVAQMVTHHTVGGCNLNPGDLMATGTMSGPDATEACAMIELTKGGKEPITLPNGESRTFIEDGDTIVITGHCEREGAVRIGFGSSVGTVIAARNS